MAPTESLGAPRTAACRPGLTIGRRAPGPAYKMRKAGQIAALSTAASLAGCDPLFDLEGAFFPSWMFCLVGGIVLTALLRPLFARVGLEPYLGPPALIYSCLAFLFS